MLVFGVILTPFDGRTWHMEICLTYSKNRCENSCSAPPTWKTGTATNLPVEEVGYGRPFRWEMARMVAGEDHFIDPFKQIRAPS